MSSLQSACGNVCLCHWGLVCRCVISCEKGGHGFSLKDVFCRSKCQSVDMISAQKPTGFLLSPGPLLSGSVLQSV